MTSDIAPPRIEPVLDEHGQPVDLAPPAGGRWLRATDGGLAPADEGTATAAGLAWPGASPATLTPPPAAGPAPKAQPIPQPE